MNESSHSDNALRTGPLHEAVGLSASASQDELDRAIDSIPNTDPLSETVKVLGDPEKRKSYEDLVFQARIREPFQVLPEHVERLAEFAAFTGISVHAVPGQPQTYTASILSDSGADAGGDSRGIQASPPQRGKEHARPAVPTDHPTASTVSKFTDATKTSLSLQIMAGLTLVGFLTFLAWMTAPRPTPPTPEEQARHAVQETLDVAGNELRYLRDQRQALDLAAHSIIGNTHAWHKVNEEPPPMAVAQWIKERNDVNNAVLFAYNRIAEFRHELDVTEIELSTEYERIARTLSTGTAIELQPAADGVAQRARHAAQQTKEYIRELQDLGRAP
jgi:hypothetical protein